MGHHKKIEDAFDLMLDRVQFSRRKFWRISTLHFVCSKSFSAFADFNFFAVVGMALWRNGETLARIFASKIEAKMESEKWLIGKVFWKYFDASLERATVRSFDLMIVEINDCEKKTNELKNLFLKNNLRNELYKRRGFESASKKLLNYIEHTEARIKEDKGSWHRIKCKNNK